MPYAFAHPAAAVPLHRLLGRLAVPSALAIGSIVPDLWLFVPFVTREETHSLWSLLWFSLPVGIVLYAAFHRVVKEPVLALLPSKVVTAFSPWTGRSLPSARWRAVVASLLAAAATHLAWDAVTHSGAGPLDEPAFALGGHPILVQQLLQHGSTVLGTLFIVWWLRPKLVVASDCGCPIAPARFRAAITAGLIGVAALVFAHAAVPVLASGSDLQTVRTVLRGAGAMAASAFGLGLLVYCVLWRLSGRSVV